MYGFDRAQEARDAMQAVARDSGKAEVFARAALALKYDAPDKPAPRHRNGGTRAAAHA
nr:hypothetical protein [Paraburkholderia heleia]